MCSGGGSWFPEKHLLWCLGPEDRWHLYFCCGPLAADRSRPAAPMLVTDFLQLRKKTGTSAPANRNLPRDLRRMPGDAKFCLAGNSSGCHVCGDHNVIISSQKGREVWSVGKVTCPISENITSSSANPSESQICGMSDILSMNTECLSSPQQ